MINDSSLSCSLSFLVSCLTDTYTLVCQSVQELVGEHQARRELVTEEVVQQYMTVRPLEF